MTKIQSPHADIRWKQRLNNFHPAYAQLKAAVELAKQRELTDLEKQGLIQAFEFTHELAWNVIKDYFEHQGNPQITGSRDAAREAFQKGLVADGEGWMEMIRSRNQTSHTYNKTVAQDIVDKILGRYCELFSDFLKKMTELSKND
jgi:nucleotidyltransferase substrate binding protein (TIGR01987 family)